MSTNTDWHAFADSRNVDSAEGSLALIRAQAPLICAGGQPGKELPLSDALRNIQEALERLAGRDALDAFRAGVSDPAELPTIAAAAILDKRPHVALAALLAAHENEPQNPTHLVNAAGLASLLDLVSEALSLLNAADQLSAELDSPLGVAGRALALNNRGHALIGLGRWAEAEAVLREAVALESHLAEARTNLSIALACQGKEDMAVRLWRASRWRTLGPPISSAEPVGPRPTVHPTVTIGATQPTAMEEPPVPGLLTVRRTGDPSEPLRVLYEVTGTARPDSDYASLARSVTLPAGAFTARIPVTPIKDGVEEPDETVVVTLLPDAAYRMGLAQRAMVTIGELLLPPAKTRRAGLLSPPDAPPEASEVFDVSAGVEWRLPRLTYPDRPEQAPTLWPVYQQMMTMESERLAAWASRSGLVLVRIATRPPTSYLMFRRYLDILERIYTHTSEPRLQGLAVEREAARAEAHALHFELEGTLINNLVPFDKAFDRDCSGLPPSEHERCRARLADQYFCQPIRAAHPRWQSAMKRWDGATRALFKAASKYMTGLAANLGDPLQHEHVMLEIESNAISYFYSELVSQALAYSSTVSRHFDPGSFGFCTGPELAPPKDTIDTPVVNDPGACPPALIAAKFQIQYLETVSLAFNCETFGIEISNPGQGLLRRFSQISFANKPGQTLQATLLVGVKASISGGLSAKAGVFIRADSQRFIDAGFKAPGSDLTGAPPGGFKVDSPSNITIGVAAASHLLGDLN